MFRSILIIFIFATNALFSQNIKRTAPFSIRGTIGIPRTIGSQMFHTAFNGVYEGSLSGNARLFGNFFAGLGFQSTNFLNSKGLFATKIFIDNSSGTATALQYNTHLNCLGGFLKLGYDKFFDRGYFTFALNTGVFDATYTNVNEDKAIENQPYVSKKFQTIYLEPEASVNFLTDGRLTFSILFSCGAMLKKFDPKAPRFNGVSEVKYATNKMPMTWINIGFGFAVLLGDLK